MSLLRCGTAVDGLCLSSNFPEEVLQQILGFCVSAPSTPLTRPSWHTRQKSTSVARSYCRGTVLLVCKSWLRIATPMFYESLILPNEEQANLCSRTLLAAPSLGYHVHNLVVMGVWKALGDVIQLCPFLESVDLTLDAPRNSTVRSQLERDAMVLCYLRGLDIKRFVLRKLPNVYLTQHKPRFATLCLSLVIPTWRPLVSKNLPWCTSNQAHPALCATESYPH